MAFSSAAIDFSLATSKCNIINGKITIPLTGIRGSDNFFLVLAINSPFQIVTKKTYIYMNYILKYKLFQV